MPRPVAHLANLDLNLLVALCERSVTRAVGRMDLRVLECPGQPEPIAEALWWHRQCEDDTAHAWLRRLLTETARRL